MKSVSSHSRSFRSTAQGVIARDALLHPPMRRVAVVLGFVGVALVISTGCRAPAGTAPVAVEQTTTRTHDTPPPSLHPKVRLLTTAGSFDLELNAEKAPLTVMNFMDYVDAGFYEGTVFHRVSKDSMIQGGAYTSSLDRKRVGLRPPVHSESGRGLVNERWAVGMVHRQRMPNSARAEFYINIAANPMLDQADGGVGYTVFGRVTDGFNTIRRIHDAPLATHPKYAAGRSAVVPTDLVVIKKSEVLVPLDRAAAQAQSKVWDRPIEELIAELIERLESETGRKAVTTPSGLTYIDRQVGDGAIPVPGSSVEVYYHGTFVDGYEFESALDRAVIMELDKLIPGWREGLQTMQEGGKRVMIIPPDLAYGSGGIPGRIPSNSTLVFEVELLQVN